MVILGLGSNLGDRLYHLRKALSAIKEISELSLEQISPLYLSEALLPENAPADWDKPYLNFAIRCNTSLSPTALLAQLKKIEWSIGRKPTIRHWGPRIVDIDILAWDDFIIKSDALTIPHVNLPFRPFAFWPLADLAPSWRFPLEGEYHGKTAAEIVEQWGSRFNGKAPFQTRQILQRVDGPKLMGIINITPDSFSDGGAFLNPEKAIAHAMTLVAQGAEILDLGAESTAPTAKAISPAVEWSRLEPILIALKNMQDQFLLPPIISLDTRHASVLEKALAIGIDWINDVSGLDDPAMRALVAASKKDCVIMHHLHLPESRAHVLPRHLNAIESVYEWGKKRLEELLNAGLSHEQLIFDPGIGFGKMAEQSLALLKNITVFNDLKMRLLIGYSRKTFLSLFTEQSFAERDIETLALTCALAIQPIDYLRVHNVEACARGLRVVNAMQCN